MLSKVTCHIDITSIHATITSILKPFSVGFATGDLIRGGCRHNTTDSEEETKTIHDWLYATETTASAIDGCREHGLDLSEKPRPTRYLRRAFQH